ncbi:hypothetical protein HMPREF0106_03881 [Bacteroides sp. D22]|nr:hypothetical protein HMPREF0106_03881 [Bacteroides sp. D22]
MLKQCRLTSYHNIYSLINLFTKVGISYPTSLFWDENLQRQLLFIPL